MGAAASTDNQPRIRLRDVARRAHLSVATVSMALSDHPEIAAQTKQRVRQISRDLGYRRRRSAGVRTGLSLGRLGLLAVGSPLEEPSHAGVVHGLGVEAQRLEARLELAAVESREPADAVEPGLRLARQVDATLLIGYVGQPLLRALAEEGRRFVVIGHVLSDTSGEPAAPASVVAPDDVAMGQLATAAMLAAGHRRVGFICETLPPGLSHARWLLGYRIAHAERGVPVDEQLVHVAGGAHLGGAPAAQHFAQLAEPPSALVAPDAPIVATYLIAAQAIGLTWSRRNVVVGADPQRSSSVGLPDVPMVYVEPRRLAVAAIRWLQQDPLLDMADTHLLLQPQAANLG